MPNVAVVGGGYAGLQAARRLAGLLEPSWSITLIDRNPYHQLITRLPEVAGGVLSPERACIPFAEAVGRRVSFVQADIHSVDPVAHTVATSTGELSADWLVLCLGSVADFLGIRGAAEHGRTVKSVSDAVRLRDAVRDRCERQSLVRIVVVGAGYTGTEVAGELAEWDRRLRRARSQSRIEVTVVALDERLLPEANARVAGMAEAVLRSKGVSFMLRSAVDCVERGRVVLASGAELPADVAVWAAHSRASSQPGDGWQRGVDGRIVVDPYLRAAGSDRVFVAGDNALAYDYARDRPAPSNAQLAVQQGALVARNIAAESRGRAPAEFRPRMLGEALSLGGKDGVAEVGGVVVSGRLALTAKQAALIRYVSGIGRPGLTARYV